MLLDLSFSTAATSDLCAGKRPALKQPGLKSFFVVRSPVTRSARLILGTMLLTLLFVGGCTNPASERASPQTQRALSILGNDALVIGAVHDLDGLEAFAMAVDTETSFFVEDRLNRILTELGIERDTESLSIYFSIGEVRSLESIAAVLFAPITEAMLEDLAERTPAMERVVDQRYNHAFSISRDEQQEAVFVSLIEEGLLLITPSKQALDQMHDRASLDADMSDSALPDADFTGPASHGQFWFATRATGSLSEIMDSLPVENSNREFALLTKAVAGAAVSLSLHETDSEGPAVTTTLFLNPRKDVTAKTLVDLVNGLVALGRLRGEEQPLLKELADKVKVSTVKNTARIAFRVSASDIRRLMKEGQLGQRSELRSPY